MQLPPGRDVPAAARLRAIAFLREAAALDAGLARTLEAEAHSVARDEGEYRDALRRCAMNVRAKPENARPGLAFKSDDELAEGTLLESIRRNEAERRAKFERMLQEKYESLATGDEHGGSLRCHRCKSTDVTWEQRQTRSADEGATSYCACNKCHARWVMR